jgi:1-acyl-sn-glycerol-3-phosphate acyltransferase
VAHLLRALVLALVRLYYPTLTVAGLDRVRAGRGPVIFAPNHPNALLDPIVLRLALGEPVAFLAKSTLFATALGRFVLGAFDALPVWRQRDEESGDGARGDKNEATFARCRALLGRSGALALFPEGTSHSDPKLKPLRTGAARIALSAEAERAFELGLRIVPVGLFYEAKTTFRSRAHVVFGAPIEVARFRAAYGADERAAAHELTAAIRAAMDEVVLQADTAELLAGATRIARALDPAAATLPVQQATAKQLLAGYRTAEAVAPERLARVVARCRAWLEGMALLGVDDPWALELAPPRKRAIALTFLALVVTAPLALAGAVAGWIPYRLAGRVAARVTQEEDVLGTTKLLGGALFLLGTWLLEGAGIAWRFGIGAGLAFVPLAALLGWIALRWDEAKASASSGLRVLFMRQGHAARALADERRALADEIAALLRESAPTPAAGRLHPARDAT